VLSLKRLPLPQDCCPSVTKDLVGTGQHAREEDWRRFLLSTRPESPPKNHLHLLQSRRGVGAGRASCVTPVSRVGVDPLAGTSSTAETSPDACTAAAGSLAWAWEAIGAVLAAAGGGPPAPISADSCC
jgi:hypothetical protein